jgi:hypothetical protein
MIAADNPKDALTMELESWIQAIIEDRQPVVDGSAGTKALVSGCEDHQDHR